MNTQIRGKDLITLGYKPGPAIGLAIEAMNKMKHSSDKERLETAEDILVNPEQYRDTPYWDKVVDKLYPPKSPYALRETCVPVEIYGNDIIEPGAFNQMYQAAKLPISIAGALMPDAHQGYGLPIGGVLATENAVIPYGVGVDIGCRMSLSVYPLRDITEYHSELTKALEKNTYFGAGTTRGLFGKMVEHEVMDSHVFNTSKLLKDLHMDAQRQLGTSGSGNHFVEWGIVHFAQDDLLPAGDYLGLLSHSGSRKLGAKIAGHYTNIAKRLRKLDPTVSNLAWLMLDEEEGMEYWEAMNLAGDYAKACHDVIHSSIGKDINEKPILKIENHHNFAWREQYDGKDVIVHRKGATPAGDGVLGVIPGSMATPGYVVRGKGNPLGINSASHGAGRMMSRSAAKQKFIWGDVRAELTEANVHLIGGGIDECPNAYKDIEKVMGYQTELVDVIAKFTPRIVRMTGDNEEPEE